MFVMDDNIDWDVMVDGKPATYVDFDNHAIMYKMLIKMKQGDQDWEDAVNTVWRDHING